MIELSSVLNKERRMIDWANNVLANVELSEEDKEISEAVNGFIKRIDRTNSQQAMEELSELIIQIVEPEVFNAPYELLGNMFKEASIGEFDKARIYKSSRNTLIARKSAPRTGNVAKSYIDFTVGNVVEEHLQIETEIPLSDLRRKGALGIAELVQFAIEEFQNAKFRAIMDHIDNMIADGGENYFACSGELTQDAMEDLNGYLDDNCFDGEPLIAGLSSAVRPISKFAGYEKSDAVKDYFNRRSVADRYRDSIIVPVKAGKKMGNGETLLAKNKIYGFAGKIGSLYTKGSMRNLAETNINTEKIHLKLTGVEFGFCITESTKIAKLEIK